MIIIKEDLRVEIKMEIIYLIGKMKINGNKKRHVDGCIKCNSKILKFEKDIKGKKYPTTAKIVKQY